MAANNQALAVQNKEVVNQVENRVSDWVKAGKLNLPENYSVGNAMKQALLKLQEAKDKNNRPALEVCDRGSIANALLSMAVQGLSPNKNQCYFIVYGTTLTLQRSYFGTIAVTKRVCPEIIDILPDVVYANDRLKYIKKHGRTIVTEHEQELGNIDKNQIVAAYCTILFKDGTENTTIMTLDQIKQAWKQSKVNPVGDDGSIKANSTHGKFTEEMAKKTVVNRACKPILNSSDDGTLLSHFIAQNDQDNAYAAQQEIVEAETASIVIDDYEVNPDTGEVTSEPEPVPEPEPQIEEEPEADTEQIEMAEFDDDPGY